MNDGKPKCDKCNDTGKVMPMSALQAPRRCDCRDGAHRLTVALYGRERVEKMVGGSHAPMLHDAADELAKFAELRGQVEEMARAFAKYSSHRTNCARRLHSEACDCGASEAAELFVGRIRGPRR